MAYQHNEIPLIQKTYEIYKDLHQHIKTFPKSDKYSLGEKLKNINLEILELLIDAEIAKRDWKPPLLQKAGRKTDLLKLLLRLANELKILDDKKYLSLIEKFQEIGRMLGGWLKTL